MSVSVQGNRKDKGDQIRFVFEIDDATNNMLLTYEDFSLPSSCEVIP